MAPVEADLLAIDCGTLTAPAGCGKTHLIADALRRNDGGKPILVLTHTNAGVAALRGRLESAGANPKSFKISTIDGWAMRLVSTFPARSALDSALLKIENPGDDYPRIRRLAADLLRSGHIAEVLRASYSRLIVDEYQDCSVLQHSIVEAAASFMRACVLGDPMQAIFDFGTDRLADWDGQVLRRFPLAGELTTPWRWINANSEDLGRWLLEVRAYLIEGREVDLLAAPKAVRWVKLEGNAEDQKRLQGAALTKPPGGTGRTLIIGDSKSKASQRSFARQTPGAVTVEAVDLQDLVAFARVFDLGHKGAFAQLANFGQSVMTNVGADDLVMRVQTILAGRARKSPSAVEEVALRFVQQPSYRVAVELLEEIRQEGGVRVHRPAILGACLRALQSCSSAPNSSFYDAAIRMREQHRLLGRPLPRLAVGSTLLLKGLEAESVVILDAERLDSNNLYVAMTRGSKQLTVCAAGSSLNP